MLKTILVLIALINLNYNVRGDGMIEVFRWKQMDFYNRGSSFVQSTQSRDRIIFPDQYKSRFPGSRNKRVAAEKITSRDQPKASITSRLDPKHGNSINNANDESGNSSYIAYNNVPMGATHFRGRLFITLPRRRVGIPSTLNYIDMQADGNNPSPKLKAYPDFATNQLMANFAANAQRIISVYRTTVDACHRLWFIDTGMLEYPDNRMQVQRPAIWIIDLKTDQTIRRFEIPTSIVDTGRGLASITIDADATHCDQAFAYLPDLLNGQLYVYSFAENRMWAFNHNYFKFDPLAGDLTVGGISFRWDDGIFSVTLGPMEADGFRRVLFHAMASNNEFMVSSQVLQNATMAARSEHGNDFQLLGSRGTNRQSTMHEYDARTGIVFYDEIQRNGIGCWNTRQPFTVDNHGTVIQDAERMIYPSDLTIDEDGNMWVMSNSLPIFIYSNLDANAVNFRIWKQNVYAAAKNTVCA